MHLEGWRTQPATTEFNILSHTLSLLPDVDWTSTQVPKCPAFMREGAMMSPNFEHATWDELTVCCVLETTRNRTPTTQQLQWLQASNVPSIVAS